jgi:NADH:ubiquinone oxidoreductase subunit 4 (subunit M)
MLWLYQRTMFGKLDNPENAKLKDLNFREIMTLAPIVVCCFWIGLYPAPFFAILDKPITELVERLDAGAPAAPTLVQVEPGRLESSAVEFVHEASGEPEKEIPLR